MVDLDVDAEMTEADVETTIVVFGLSSFSSSVADAEQTHLAETDADAAKENGRHFCRLTW